MLPVNKKRPFRNSPPLRGGRAFRQIRFASEMIPKQYRNDTEIPKQCPKRSPKRAKKTGAISERVSDNFQVNITHNSLSGCTCLE